MTLVTMSPMSNTPDCKHYLEYLDKEMTIMGILSAVPLAAAGGALSLVLGKDGSGPEIWKRGHWAIVIGSTLCVAAAGLFYKQRSLLAWFYGQLCLAPLRGEDLLIMDLLDGVDAWSSWIYYSWGFDLLVAGFVEYAGASVASLWLPSNKVILWSLRLIPLTVLLATVLLQRHVLTNYAENDDPWTDWWRNEIRKPLPHQHVYARIQCSPIHGVGVFAIQPISKGTYIFPPDNDSVVKIEAIQLVGIPKALKAMYDDFCPESEGVYTCPTSFNKLTPAWFLNDSLKPNVGPDRQLRFLALRDIHVGEELTADYTTYSGKVPWR